MTHQPTSYAQRRFWFLDRLNGSSLEYHVTQTWRLAGDLKLECLQDALDGIVRGHELLRARFVDIDGEPRQVIEPPQGVRMPVEDVSRLNEGERAERVRDAVQREGTEPIDLAQGPPARFRLLKLSEREHVLLRTVHHIATDGWSDGVLCREAATLLVPVVRESMEMLYQFEHDYRFDSGKVERAFGLTATTYREGIAATLMD